MVPQAPIFAEEMIKVCEGYKNRRISLLRSYFELIGNTNGLDRCNT
jgi:hypothetical protein